MNDAYTKTMLTLIALFLGFICLQNVPLPLSAQAESEPRARVMEEKPLAVRIVNEPRFILSGISENVDTALRVLVVETDAPLDVNITDVSPNIFHRLPVDSK